MIQILFQDPNKIEILILQQTNIQDDQIEQRLLYYLQNPFGAIHHDNTIHIIIYDGLQVSPIDGRFPDDEYFYRIHVKPFELNSAID